MNTIKKKMLVEGLVYPPALTAISAGFSIFLFGIGLHSLVASFIGFSLFFLGIGASITNLVLKFDKIKSQVLLDLAHQKKLERDTYLDDLDNRLLRDRDPRDQGYLREIRRLHDSLEEFIQENVNLSHKEILLPRINELYEACINELEYSYRLWEIQRVATGASKDRIKQEREDTITAVGQTVENFSEAVMALMTLGQKRGKSLEEVRDKLDSDLAIAKKVEERIKEIENPSSPNFEEYLR